MAITHSIIQTQQVTVRREEFTPPPPPPKNLGKFLTTKLTPGRFTVRHCPVINWALPSLPHKHPHRSPPMVIGTWDVGMESRDGDSRGRIGGGNDTYRRVKPRLSCPSCGDCASNGPDAATNRGAGGGRGGPPNGNLGKIALREINTPGRFTVRHCPDIS